MSESRQSGPAVERVEDLLREVGTLLIALTPLDAVLWDVRYRLSLVSAYIAFGVILVVIALLFEQRRSRGH
jgi:hypothetical protein